MHDRGSDGASYCEPKKKYMSLKFYTLKKPGIRIFYPKKYKTLYLNTDSILIYTIKQTLDLKNM